MLHSASLLLRQVDTSWMCSLHVDACRFQEALVTFVDKAKGIGPTPCNSTADPHLFLNVLDESASSLFTCRTQ